VEIDVHAENSTVLLDPVRVRQAVQNLVENALEHGRGPVVVAAKSKAGRITIDVVDQGPGFAAEVLDATFEPFTRSRPAAAGLGDAAGASGSGLGLAIVRAVAEAHGGIAQAGNDPAGGALVRIELETGDVATTAEVTGRRSPGAGARPR
ncbi:MAG: sensor histidine kinase, partial [Mycobacteriales bacterium]